MYVMVTLSAALQSFLQFEGLMLCCGAHFVASQPIDSQFFVTCVSVFHRGDARNTILWQRRLIVHQGVW